MPALFASVLVAILVTASCKSEPQRSSPGADWEYLSRYRTDVALPALLVGEKKVLDAGCLKALAPRLEPGADKVEQRFSRTEDVSVGFKAGIRAALEAVSGRADVDLERASTALETFEVSIEGITLASVPVSSVRADFTNEVCVLPELQWLTRDRDVVVQALLAKKIEMKSGHAVDERARRSFEIAAEEATGHVGGEGRLDWKTVSGEDDSVTIEATDVYYAYVPTELEVKLCPKEGAKALALASGERADVCNVSVSVEPLAATPDQFKLNVDRRFGQTETYLHTYGKRELVAMGESRLVETRVDRPDDAGRSRVEIAVWLVGPSGSEGGGGGD